MRRKCIALLLSSLLVLFSACGQTATQSTSTENTTGSDSVIAESKADSTPEATTPVEDTTAGNNSAEESVEEVEEPTYEFESVSIGDTISNDFVEMTIDRVYINKLIQNISTSFPYCKIMKNEMADTPYFGISGTIKNIAAESYDPSFYGEVIFDGKYTYELNLVSLAANENFTETLDPFGTATYYLTANVPAELINTYSTCTVQFGFADSFTATTVDYSLCDYLYEVTTDTIVSGGDVALNDTVTGNGLDFTLANIQFAEVVDPETGANQYNPAQNGRTAESGNVFAIADITITNNNAFTILPTEFLENDVNYNNGTVYQFDVNNCAGLDGTDDFSIAAGQTRSYRCITEVPEEVATNTSAPLTITVTLNGSTFNYTVR